MEKGGYQGEIQMGQPEIQNAGLTQQSFQQI